MSNEINALQKFFEYLTQTDKNANQVVEEADLNDDDHMTKGEFKKYVDGVGLNLTADEVSQVYKIFDTKTNGKISGTRLNNRNALDEDEVKAMQAKLNAYKDVRDALDDVFTGVGYQGVTIPPELSYHVSRASVEESVMANMNSNFLVKDLAGLLTQAIARTGANGYGQATFTEKLNEYKASGQIPASYNGDDDFQSLLSAYVRSLDADTALNSISDEVNDIIDSYFASAEVGSSRGGQDLNPYCWNDAQGLNGLQLAVLADLIIKDYKADDETYNKFKSEFDAAIQGFISDTCSGMTFSEIKAKISTFKDSKYGKALEVLITLSNFSAPGNDTSQLNNAFYNKLDGKLGSDFAQALAEADVNYVETKGLYYNILQTVYQMILSGEIKNDDDGAIVDKMIELIIENYTEFKSGLGLGSPNGDVEDLYNKVHILVENNGALAAVRTAAIAYLDALTALGNEDLNSFIKATFGEDYKKAIENLMSQSSIDENIDKVQAKYVELKEVGVIAEEIDPSSYTVTSWNTNGIKWVDEYYEGSDGNKYWKNSQGQYVDDQGNILTATSIPGVFTTDSGTAVTLTTKHNGYFETASGTSMSSDSAVLTCRAGGGSQTISCSANINKGDDEAVTNTATTQITYGIVDIGGNTGSSATIDENTGEITFTPGETAGPAYIKVKVMVNGVEVGITSIKVEVQAKPEFTITDANISSGGIRIPVGGNDKGWATSRNNASNNFYNIVAKNLKEAAIEAGYDKTDADLAAETLTSYFKAAMNALNSALDKNLSKQQYAQSQLMGDNFTYTRYTRTGAKTVTCSDRSAVRLHNKTNKVDEYNDLTGSTASTGIYIGCDTTADDDYWCYVNGTRMFELFVSFLG